MMKFSNDPITLAELTKEKQHHNSMQMRERTAYQDRIQQARTHSNSYLSLAIDGKTTDRVPIKLPLPKTTSGVPRLKLHVVSLLNNNTDQAYFHVFHDHWASNGDVTATVLLDYLKSLADSSTTWPHTLYLQLDNCIRENKNHTLFAVLASLVKQNWFKDIYVDYLPVSHTHINIDQRNSPWSKYFWTHGLGSIEDVQDFLEKAYPQINIRPHLIKQHYIYNFEELLDPYITTFSKFTQFRSFHFTMQNNLPGFYYTFCHYNSVFLS